MTTADYPVSSPCKKSVHHRASAPTFLGGIRPSLHARIQHSWVWELSLSSAFYWHASRSLFFNNSAHWESSGPHRHKHTTDWTNDTLLQSIFSSAAWPRVTGHHCHRLLKEATTMGSLCEATDHFTSTSPGLLMLPFLQFSSLMSLVPQCPVYFLNFVP